MRPHNLPSISNGHGSTRHLKRRYQKPSLPNANVIRISYTPGRIIWVLFCFPRFARQHAFRFTRKVYTCFASNTKPFQICSYTRKTEPSHIFISPAYSKEVYVRRHSDCPKHIHYAMIFPVHKNTWLVGVIWIRNYYSSFSENSSFRAYYPFFYSRHCQKWFYRGSGRIQTGSGTIKQQV